MATRVTELRKQFDKGANPAYPKRDLIQDLMMKLDREHPGTRELMEKERPLIAELVQKLRTREHVRAADHSSSESTDVDSPLYHSSEGSLPQDSVMSSSSESSIERSQLDKLLRNVETRRQFKDFVSAKGGLDSFEFWMACFDCEQKAKSCASLAKKIVTELMRDSHRGENCAPMDKSDMDLALRSAVVAVKYELMLHKEETHAEVGEIVDRFMRNKSPQQVHLSPQVHGALMRAVDSEDRGEGDILAVLSHARIELLEWMERSFYWEFSEAYLNQ